MTSNSVDSELTFDLVSPENDPHILKPEYECPEIHIGEFLAVSVQRGAPISKHGNDKHPAFETKLRVLTIEELTHSRKELIDIEAYFPIQQPSLVVFKRAVFDTYRTLNADLEKLNVYSLNQSRFSDIEETNEEDMEKTQMSEILLSSDSRGPSDAAGRRRSSRASTNGKEVIIGAPFPRTFRRQSFGIKLTEDKLLGRMKDLHEWMGALLLSFSKLNNEAQGLLIKFLGLDVRSQYQHQAVLSMLRGGFSPPLRLSQLNPKANDYFGIAPDGQSVLSLSPNSEPPEEDNMDFDNFEEINPRKISIEGNTEIIIEDILGFMIVRGEFVGKSNNDNKNHPSYEVDLRILRFEEKENKSEDVDIDKFNELAKIVFKPKVEVFDAFRNLQQQLEKFNVSSLKSSSIDSMSSYDLTEKDSIKSETGSNKIRKISDLIEISALFPRTYRRQSFGITLSDTKLNKRSRELHLWMGKLLQSFGVLNTSAQDVILEFLGFHEGGENISHRDLLKSMLLGAFVLPFKQKTVVEDPVVTKKEQNNELEKNKDPAPKKCCVLS